MSPGGLGFVVTRLRATALVLSAVLTVALAACSSDKEPRLGLRDVRAIGPEGQACYDHCANWSVGCRHMCPRNAASGCIAECEQDAVDCLKQCPELVPIHPLPPTD